MTTSYVYDANASLPVVLDDGTRKYVWGLGLAYAVDTAGGVQVYHTDGLGSVRAMTDGTGSVVQTYQTDEFGVPTRTTEGRLHLNGATSLVADLAERNDVRWRQAWAVLGSERCQPLLSMLGVPAELAVHPDRLCVSSQDAREDAGPAQASGPIRSAVD